MVDQGQRGSPVNTPITEELRAGLIADILDQDVRFNQVMGERLAQWRTRKITEARFLQLRNNARGNALDAARRASRECLV